jgi:hypothetical protein
VISFGAEVRVFVSTQPIDFRKGVHGLVALVAEGLGGQPYSGDVFVFSTIGLFEAPGFRRLRAGSGDKMARGRRFRLACCSRGNDARDGSATGDADRGSLGVVAGGPEGDEAADESRLSRLVLLAIPGVFG